MHLRKSSLFIPIISVILSFTVFTLSAIATELPSENSYRMALCVPLFLFIVRSAR